MDNPNEALREVMQSGPMWRDREKPKDWRRVYLNSLKKHGRVTFAARAAGVCQQHVSKTMRRSPRFKRACLKAQAIAQQARIDLIEAEIQRRGVDGYDEPIVANGEIIGTKRKYSDRCLIAQARAEMPRKYDRRKRDARRSQQIVLMGAEHRKLVLDPAIRALSCALAEALAAPDDAKVIEV